MKSKRLQLNPAKTAVLWCATSRRRHQLPTTAMLVDDIPVTPVQNVRDLGIYIDGDLSMRTHIQRTTSSCFAALRQLRQIRRFVPTATFQTLTVALVNQRMDYGNSTCTGRHSSLLNAQAAVIERCRTADFPLLTLSSVYTGCVCRSEFNSKSPCSHRPTD